MVGLPWGNNPTSGSIAATSAKQEQEVSSGCLGNRKTVAALSALCLLLFVSSVALSVLHNNESDSKPEWKRLLFDFQNISDTSLSLTKANNDLRGDNEILKESNAWLQDQAKVLNRTAARLMSANLAGSLENRELTERLANLTSANFQLSQEGERLVQLTSEQEEAKRNMSRYLVDLSSQREEEEERRLSKLFQTQEENRDLVEMIDRLQGEVKKLGERETELQEQKQNLSAELMRVSGESRRNQMDQTLQDLRAIQEAYRSLDLHCPVVNHQTTERICKKCPDSWRPFESRCYYFSSRLLTWSSSRAWCRTQGGDLLIVNSQPEQTFIFEGSRALEQSGSRLWIGLTDAEQEGRWLWVDGSSVTSDVQYWLSRPGLWTEPDDWKLEDPLGEDCGHIDTNEIALKSWMDGSCTKPYRWICEKDV